ncbi:eukaryotic translation initiation factor 2 subunit 2-like [Watersipora subatra]|uniref:eukaryotic translation initiation factor 2 subunit 2-like n=1 Tax=Watersipora subatra TaxID=2589382 RepID=UPI00355C0218
MPDQDTEMEQPSEQIFDPSMKKKKKKKKTPFDLESALAGGTPVTDEATTEVKSELAEPQIDMKSVAETLPEVAEDDFIKEFGSHKKKSKDKKKVKINDTSQVLGQEEAVRSVKVEEGEYTKTNEDYTYEQLLNRVFNIMKERNPDMELGQRKMFVMKPPQLARVGTKKTAFTNFADICKLLKRPPKHLLQFLLAELGTSGNVDANNSLILKGKYQQKHIETVLRRYIKEYVTCHTCRSPDTLLEREIRLFFLQCKHCGSRSSVASIKSGFQAVTGKRAALRAKTA